MVLLPFDAHNHVHLGSSSSPSSILDLLNDSLSGMAIMSTHPRDFPIVTDLRNNHNNNNNNNQQALLLDQGSIIPCMGVHPWFLHELTERDWEIISSPSDADAIADANNENDDDKEHDDSSQNKGAPMPRWVCELESLLQADPSIAVGEIGLDNFHFNDPVTKELSTDMETQMLAMELQIGLAIQYQRPVSLHCVRAMGSMLEVWNKILLAKTDSKQQKQQQQHKLPPRIYFHAFGGKAATVIQLVRLLEPKQPKRPKKKKPRDEGENKTLVATKEEKPQSSTTITGPKVYFGFAPIVNFQSPKTLDVIRAVGLERLVLETDHEEAYKVPATMKEGIRVISDAFGITEEELIQITNKNAKELYMID
ncbi:unnamed protein product [Cylindrotheca closterium]|uniref:Uncharacterized protein n=1 Tax=Cylindrotheca closterium TaxID=2856 RepID=A0AAD2CFA8_9STRA|nr:unnamed protein product [Cylindrotheca closterium]